MNSTRKWIALASLGVCAAALRCGAPCECAMDDASAPGVDATTDGARDGAAIAPDSAAERGSAPPACQLATGGTNHYVDGAVAASGKGTSWSVVRFVSKV